MPNAIAISLLVLLLSTCAVAQTPASAPPVRDVELCELKLHPKTYDGQFVRVRGNISFGFEDFTFSANCTMRDATYSPSIWLTYGGDEPEAAVYCCVNRNARSGKDLEINGHKVGLVRDSDYHKLRSRLESGRLSYPDGTVCFGDDPVCRFYADVQATITGLFTAKPDDTEVIRGYGHFGCCHLLAIQQVSDVTATRTAVPAGGQFRCERETWNTDCQASENGECSIDEPSVFAKVTAHWNDSVSIVRGDTRSHRGVYDEQDDKLPRWFSDDLLTAYWVESQKAETGALLKVLATRQKCTPVSEQSRPSPKSADASCKNFSRSWREDKKAAKKWDAASEEERRREDATWNVTWGIEAEAGQKVFPIDRLTAKRPPNSVGWHVLGKQLQKWQLAIEPDVQPRECEEDAMFTDVLFAYCRWFSADGMSSYSVNLIKYQPEGSRGKVSRLPWRVSDVNVRKCGAEP